MELKRIGILIIAATVLAVVTSGIASAKTISPYSGTLSTTYWPGLGVHLDAQSSGAKTGVVSGDVLQWANSFTNLQTAHSVSAMVYNNVWTTSSPHSALLPLTNGRVDGSTSISVPAGGSYTGAGTYTGTVQDNGPAFIEAYHGYVDSGVYYESLFDTQMTYSP